MPLYITSYQLLKRCLTLHSRTLILMIHSNYSIYDIHCFDALLDRYNEYCIGMTIKYNYWINTTKQ